MAEPHTDLATGFETKTCTRCGGCGRYSFNQMHRDMCYGCSGGGTVYTKRGAVAREYFQKSILTAAGDVKAGWIARGNNGKWFPVVSVEPYQMRGSSLIDGVMVPYDRPGVDVCYGKVGHIQDVTAMIPAQPNIETVAALRQAALAYQQTLSQAGTVLKRTRLTQVSTLPKPTNMDNGSDPNHPYFATFTSIHGGEWVVAYGAGETMYWGLTEEQARTKAAELNTELHKQRSQAAFLLACAPVTPIDSISI